MKLQTPTLALAFATMFTSIITTPIAVDPSSLVKPKAVFPHIPFIPPQADTLTVSQTKTNRALHLPAIRRLGHVRLQLPDLCLHCIRLQAFERPRCPRYLCGLQAMAGRLSTTAWEDGCRMWEGVLSNSAAWMWTEVLLASLLWGCWEEGGSGYRGYVRGGRWQRVIGLGMRVINRESGISSGV
jgi:hypothetical protein